MQRIFRKLLIAATCSMAINAHAIGTGFYMGIMMGPATNNAPTLQAVVAPAPENDLLFPDGQTSFTTTPAVPRSTQFAMRIYLGNQWNQWMAFELGGTFFSSIRYDSRDVQTSGSTDQRVRDVDAILKGILPIRWFSAYGKVGVAAIYLTRGGAYNPEFTPATPNQRSQFSQPSFRKFKFGPTVSIGASYDLDQSWVVDASYNLVSVGDSVGSQTYFALGISYHFTDKYCGQFLCDD